MCIPTWGHGYVEHCHSWSHSVHLVLGPLCRWAHAPQTTLFFVLSSVSTWWGRGSSILVWIALPHSPALSASPTYHDVLPSSPPSSLPLSLHSYSLVEPPCTVCIRCTSTATSPSGCITPSSRMPHPLLCSSLTSTYMPTARGGWVRLLLRGSKLKTQALLPMATPMESLLLTATVKWKWKRQISAFQPLGESGSQEHNWRSIWYLFDL